MIWFPPSPFWSQSCLPEAWRGSFPLARRNLLKIGGFAVGAVAFAGLAGCAAGDRGAAEVLQPTSIGFFTDGTDFVD
jgi:hypothetical protein